MADDHRKINNGDNGSGCALGERGSGWPLVNKQKSEGRVRVVGMETMVTAAVCTASAGS